MGMTMRADTAHQKHGSKCSVQGQESWPHTQRELHSDPCLRHSNITFQGLGRRKQEILLRILRENFAISGQERRSSNKNGGNIKEKLDIFLLQN